MQTTNLTNHLTGMANVNTAAAQRTNGQNGGSDGSQFSAMLSSEMEQRQPAAPVAPARTAPAAAPKSEAPRPQAANKPAQSADDAPAHAEASATQPAQANAGNGAHAAKDAKDAKDADSEAPADDSAAKNDAPADPASAMLALMASLQPQAAAPADGKPDTAAAFDALTGNGRGLRGKRGDAAQLTALQGALKGLKDGAADAATGKTFAEMGALKNPTLAAAGAALGDDKADLKDAAASASGKTGADASADLHAALASLKGDVRSAASAADLALQQTRDAAKLAPAQGEAMAAQAAAQLQPAVMEAVQMAAGAETLTARVGTDAWENQVGQKVVYMVGGDEQTASLTLNPPDLGPMQVVLSVTNDGASVTFSSNQLEVRQALENALPRLREMMSESGIALGNATVNAGMPDGRQAQQGQQDGSRGNGPWNRNERGDDGATVLETVVRPARTRALGDNSMVDTFA